MQKWCGISCVLLSVFEITQFITVTWTLQLNMRSSIPPSSGLIRIRRIVDEFSLLKKIARRCHINMDAARHNLLLYGVSLRILTITVRASRFRNSLWDAQRSPSNCTGGGSGCAQIYGTDRYGKGMGWL